MRKFRDLGITLLFLLVLLAVTRGNEQEQLEPKVEQEIEQKVLQSSDSNSNIQSEVDSILKDLVVETIHGDVRGYYSNETNTYIFKGVRYAQSPVGQLRWKAPRTVFNWEGIQNATKYPPSCWNSATMFSMSRIDGFSEDCLFVNVWSPRAAFEGKEKLPVAVYIHGGGFILGSTSREEFTPNPELFASNNQIVYVNLQYRLGQLGFLAMEVLEEEGEEEGKKVGSGNLGIQDQIAALEWVKKNIERFGGDPNQITVMGQSAGAFSICTLIVSPQTKGLFQQVIMQSGGCNYPFPKKEESLNRGDRFIEELGCSDKGDSKAILKCLREKEPSLIMSTLKNKRGILWFEGETWFPTVDGVIIPDSPIKLIKKSKFDTNLKIMTGSNDDEASMFIFLGFPLYLGQQVFEDILRNTFGFRFSYKILKSYEILDSQTPAMVANHILSDMWECSSIYAANVFSNVLTNSLYIYHFSKNPEGWTTFPFSKLGAYHGVELTYIYQGPYKSDWPESDREVAIQANQAWSNFIKTGQPNSHFKDDQGNLIYWPTYQESKKLWLFNETQELMERRSICDLWDSSLKPSGELKMPPEMKEPFFSMLINELLFYVLTRHFKKSLLFVVVSGPILFLILLNLFKSFRKPTTLKSKEKIVIKFKNENEKVNN